MPLINWTNTFSVGVETLDNDHKVLVSLVNEMNDHVQAGEGKEPLVKIIDELVKYTKYHFACEEHFFARTGYALADAHKREREGLARQVIAFQQRFKHGDSRTLSVEAMNFLTKWMVHHILGSDRKYGPHLNANGVD